MGKKEIKMNKKEFKKMPYLEIEYHTNITVDDFVETDKPIYIDNYEMKKNINRIKLPCFCTFEWEKQRRFGILQNDDHRFETEVIQSHFYKLYEMDRQTSHKVGGLIAESIVLEYLIETYKINIGKVKIIYCEVFSKGEKNE